MYRHNVENISNYPKSPINKQNIHEGKISVYENEPGIRLYIALNIETLNVLCVLYTQFVDWFSSKIEFP